MVTDSALSVLVLETACVLAVLLVELQMAFVPQSDSELETPEVPQMAFVPQTAFVPETV